jgi:hypothetical protein
MSTKFVLLSIGVLTSLVAQLFVASPARAECSADGQTFQTGETYGPYVCLPDGTWKPQ